MKTFLRKTGWFALIGSFPFLFVLVTYVILDPFKVIRHYDPIYLGNVEGEVNTSRDYVGTVTLLNNYEKVPYDSFIFGNSRSFIFEVDQWQKHLLDENQCFHYNAPAEALYAITKKVEFIDKKGLSIENVLLVLDYSTLSKYLPNAGHLYIISPQLVDYENIVDFHLTFFKAFLTPDFLRAYGDFKFTSTLKPYMIESHLLNNGRRDYNDITNELGMEYYENLIEKGEFYTPERLAVFFPRDSVESFHPQVIQESQKIMLSKMQHIFEKHNTDCRVVISPGYDQKKLHPEDLEYLREVFGKHQVYDFSGKNQYTADYRNYYETIHYRPGVARDILDEIYRDGSQEFLVTVP